MLYPRRTVDKHLHSALALPETASIHLSWFSDTDLSVEKTIQLPSSLSTVSEKRRREFLAGRYCAISALKSAGYERHPELSMDANRLPQWPPGWLGSISHSDQGAAAIVSKLSHCHVLAIDMEKVIAKVAIGDLGRQIACPGELEQLSDHPLQEATTLLFSAKEVLYKALYPKVRRFLDFSAARLISASSNQLRLILCENWCIHLLKGETFVVNYTLHEGHIVTALCAPETANA
jgi:enterobactin synthetase component D